MRLAAVIVLFSVLGFYACESDDVTTPGQEHIVQAYDTIEMRYQKLSELAMDIVDNVESDDSINTKRLYDLVDNIPTVMLDFREISNSKNDIRNFIAHQTAIENEVRNVFAQLDSSSSWKNAPLVQEFKTRFEQDQQEIIAAKAAYDKTVDEAKLDLKISLAATKK